MTTPTAVKQQDRAKIFARENILAYAIGMVPEFIVGTHHRKLAIALQNVLRRTNQRVIVTMPPRHGKSLLSSQLFSSWYLGHYPERDVILASYGQDLSTDFGRWVRNAMHSPFFRFVFPEVAIADDSDSKSRFHTSRGGGFVATSRGGSLTGKGGHLILIDDIFKNRQDASSQTTRQMVTDWYKSTLRTRLASGGSIVVVNTRWHEEDLIGFLTANTDENSIPWQHVNIPAISTEGKALWPEKFPIETLNQIKKDIGTFEFEALYQQNPTPLEGGIIKRNWIKYYTALPDSFDNVIMSWDMTFKDSESSDFVTGGVWGVKGASFYLIDQVRARMDFVATCNAFVALSAKHKRAITKLVEDKANGSAVISALKQKVSGIVPVNPRGSKHARLQAVSPLFEAGNVYIPSPNLAPWVNDYVEELVGFPYMKNDDQVDQTSQALQHLSDIGSNYLSKLLTL